MAEEVGKTSCRHDPKDLTEHAIGMYHCPDCGIMVMAGYRHFTDEECKFQCDDWEAPEYADTERETST